MRKEEKKGGIHCSDSCKAKASCSSSSVSGTSLLGMGEGGAENF